MNIVIIENSNLLLTSLASLVVNTSETILLIKSQNSTDLIELIGKIKFDVAIVNFNKFENDPFKLFKKLKAKQADIKIIALVDNNNPPYIKKCMNLGVDYCLVLSEDFEKIPKILEGLKKIIQ